ncbi:hypothetical protein D9758_007892 [Tetrapyrgos nigripes]|uniref:Uncharacterized protein n=1 Tax=Tetrapyrgos nigripes TaxID=182062 RepID=A0A8H5D4H8_9AGAR|nr:hypothetical protein D9758_007892 [Tetrapyrgos nigripes]
MPDLPRLLEGPVAHDPIPTCSPASQVNLTTAWTVAAIYLADNATFGTLYSSPNDASPLLMPPCFPHLPSSDTPPEIVKSIFEAFTRHITCELCLKNRDKRIDEIVAAWAELQESPVGSQYLFSFPFRWRTGVNFNSKSGGGSR